MLKEKFEQYCKLAKPAKLLGEGKNTYIKQLPNGKYKVFSTNTGKSFGPEFKSKKAAEKHDDERRKAYFAGGGK